MSISDLNKKGPSRTLAWTMWALTALSYAFQYIFRLLPNVIKDDILVKFSVNADDFGTFSGMYYLGYALAHIPVGVLIDRASPRVVISCGMLLCSVGVLPLVYLDGWIWSVIGRFVLGVGSSTAILGVFYVIRISFPSNRFASILGMAVTVGLLGALFGTRPVSILIDAFGWKNVIQGMFLIGVVLAVVLFVLIPCGDRSSAPKNSVLLDLQEVLTNKRVWLVALCAALMVGPLEGFADAWGVPFFKTVYGFDKAQAEILPSLVFFGMCFGAPMLAYIGEKMKRFYLLTVICATVMCVVFLVMLFSSVALEALYVLMVLVGVLSGYQVFIMFLNSKNAEVRLSGVVTSVTNMTIMSFGFLFHKIIGHTVNSFWGGLTENGVPVYSAEAYTSGLVVIPVALFVAALGFIYLRPKDEYKLLED